VNGAGSMSLLLLRYFSICFPTSVLRSGKRRRCTATPLPHTLLYELALR